MKGASSTFAWKGFVNVGVILISGLLSLFIFYPVLTLIRNNARNLAIDGNIQLVKRLYCMCPPPTIINHFIAGLTNASSRFQMPELIDGQA